MISLYLLQAICLSGRATRLGQYASSSPSPNSETSSFESLQSGLRTYLPLRQTLSALYPHTQLEPHLGFCDSVYTALRETNPFKFAILLETSQKEGGYRVDGWQRLLLLQVVMVLRGASWAVARKAFLYLPVSVGVAALIKGTSGDGEEAARRGEDEEYLVRLLLLSTNLFPAAQQEQEVEEKGTRVREETPDEWDTEPSTPPSIPSSFEAAAKKREEEEERRLYNVLLSYFQSSSSDLSTRLTTIKTGSGHAVKLK